MPAKFIKCVPSCHECNGQLCVDEVIIDFINCNYCLFTTCIVCGEEQIIILSLEDFIDLDYRRFFPPIPPSLLN